MELRARSRRLAVTSRSIVPSSGLVCVSAGRAAMSTTPTTAIDTPIRCRIVYPPCCRWIGSVKSFAEMLQYNVLHRQSDRPIGPVRTPAWIIAGAITGALALHGLVATALFALAGPPGGAIDEAAITIFIDPGAPPVATATERPPARAPEPETTAAPSQPALQESIPPPEPMESPAPPDFSQPPPPPPPRVEPPKPPPPVQKVEPKRAAPAPAARAAPPSPAPGSAPAAAAPSAPSAGAP